MAYKYPYLNNAFCMYFVQPTDKVFLGERYKVLITDIAALAADLSAAIAANPSFEFYSYTSGNAVYQFLGGWMGALYPAFRDAGIYTKENAWWHYDVEKLHTSGYPGYRSTTQLVNGEAVGIIPAYDDHPLRSRMIGVAVGTAHDSGLKTIASIERLASPANTVEVTFAAAHGFEIGDWLEIAGVTGGATSFNGVFDITSLPTTLKLRYAQTGAAESGTGGTARYQSWPNFALNYKNNDWRDFLESLISTYGHDAGGNKANGYYFDSILNQLIWKHVNASGVAGSGLDFEKCKEYLDDGGSPTYDSAAINTWMFGYLTPWLDHIRAAFTTYRGSAAKTAVNADSLGGFNVDDWDDFYDGVGTGPDLMHFETAVSPSNTDPTSMELKWKKAWSYMELGKKIIYQSISYGLFGSTSWHGVPVVWTNESGNLWYTDAWIEFPKGLLTGISTTNVNAGTRKDSKASVTAAGHFYQDPTSGRVYVYSTSQPTGNITTIGLEPHRMLALAQYLVMCQHTNSYFFYFRSGADYSLQPNTIDCWFDAMDYVGLNMGAPVVGGVKSDGTLATDIWAESCATSTKGYIFWTKTESGKVHNVYARKFANGVALFRLRSDYTTLLGSDPVAIPIPFTYRVLHADGSVGPDTTAPFTLALGEGAVLLTGTEENPELPPIETPTTFKGFGMGLELTQQGYVNRRYGKRELRVRSPAYLEGAFTPLNVVADPGNTVKAIPVLKSGIVSIVTAGAETRTLAAPTFVGQMLCITMKTAVGAMTLTCATTLNQAGNNTAVMTPAGDTLLLLAVYIGANLRWRVMGNDGAVLSTV